MERYFGMSLFAFPVRGTPCNGIDLNTTIRAKVARARGWNHPIDSVVGGQPLFVCLNAGTFEPLLSRQPAPGVYAFSRSGCGRLQKQ